MAVYNIYHKDGSRLKDSNGKGITVHSIEYNGTWMGECFVTVTFENEAPISFSIGDYIEYRGERFEINYDPGKIKCASKDSYGGAFKYDSVKFNALSDELVRCDMLDLVLYDNQLHYTALPQFSFYVESLDDLLDRIQANLDELYGKASWKLYSRNKERSVQRGGLESEWNSIYGEGTADNVIDSTSISISDQTCWDALSLVNSQFDVNFIIRNRNVYVGTAGMPTTNIFKYGKGEGLYEIEQNSESDQMIITRLRAYGSNRNLPNHYYADLGGIPFLNITGDYHEGSTDNGLSVMMEDSTYAGMFTDIISDNGSNMKHCRIRGSIGGYEFEGTLELVKKDSLKSTTRLIAEGKEVCDAIKAKIDAGIVEVDFIRGANKSKFDGNRINYVSNLPNNMACDRLMLPGFPNKTLKEWWDAQTEEKKAWLNPSGKEHIFSNEIYRPYVDSLNIEKIGVRPSSVFFDQDDKVNGIVEIYPTIEEMEVDGVRIDEIYTGTNIEDDGRFGDGETVANVDIYLSPKIDFDIRGLMQDDFTIHMKDGMCAGREFKIAGCTKQNDGSWRLTIERQPDDSLNLYFPYNDFQIKKGDHFVLSGIELPDAYVEAASEKLLKYCIAYLDKNDYTRYVYQPKVDEIFMARQHDTAMADASGLTKSLYLTLKEGDIMLFKDDDLGIDAEITIDQLTIKEENGKIPTYEITLREEKEVGTIQKIQNQISSITNGNGGSLSGGTGDGLSSSQIKNLIDAIGSDRFLSKLNHDTAAGVITFLQGTNWGNFTSETGAAMTIDPTTGQTYMEVDRLKVRLKAFFEQLEVQKVGYVGGKIVVSKGQGVDILDVEEIYDSEGILSAYRCYFLGEQEGRRINNLLRVDDQMICKDDNISEGSTDGATNKYYWRLATAVSSDVVKRGNNVCHWVDLSATDCDTNSDIPEIGDTICQLGNRTDVDRQGAEVLSVVDANSPSFTIYAGIDSYSLVNKEYIDMGVINGKAYCNIYGSTYIGDRERNTGYLRWNDNTKTFEIKGTIDISSPLSSGGTIGGAIDNAANAYKGEFDAFTSNVNEVIGGFQAQIDGVIETWFYEPEPTLGNEPAVNWTDNATKDKHLGDLYYSGNGLAYRFQKEGDNYVWKQIDDTAITKALAEAKAANDAANAAQGTADSKMRVFVVQPTADDEYSVGDMWVNATYGTTYKDDILKCKTPKKKGEAFSIDHWEKASKYTDDTVAKEAKKAADDANASITTLGNKVSGIYDLTDEAFKDRVIDKTERDSLQKVLADLEQDWADVASSYSKLTGNSLYTSVAADVRTDFESAYSKLKATYDSFVVAVNNVISATQVTDSLINGLYNNYENFKTDYAAYVSNMTVVTKQIDTILNKSVSDLVTELGGYSYLKKATAENNTLIEGGLILSTLIGLGFTDTNKLFHVMSGMSGIYDTQKAGNGIAFWAGGSMVDKQNDASDNPAQFLIRHDGTGYAAGGNLWWEKNGKVHADPMSFVVGEDNLKNLLGLFQPVYSGGSEYKNITGIEPLFQFTKLRVEGGNITNGELIGGLQIGDTAKFYIKDGVLFLEGDLAVTGGITMYASNGVTSGLIDQVYAILDSTKFEIENGVITIKGDIGGGTVKGATVGGTAVTLDSATGILQFPAYPTATNKAATLAWNTTSTIATVAGTDITVKLPANPNTDTKNTAGSTDTSSKIFLIGATSQAANPQTYSHDTAYVGTDGCLYSGGTKVSVSGHTHSYITSSLCTSLDVNSGNFSTEYVGGNNAVATKPSGVDAFGVMKLRTANGWYGQILLSSNTAQGLYYRTGIGLSSSVSWKKLLDSGNFGDYAAAKSHTHTIANITNLQATLDGKAAASHTHSYLPLSGGSLSGLLSVRNIGNDSAGYYNQGAMQIREYNYGGSQSDTWGNAPRLTWHWSGRVAAQIGLASNGYLYTAPLTGTTFYKLVYESGTWGINITGNAGYASSAGNADTLDGNHASAFAAAGHTHSYLPLSGGTLSGLLNVNGVRIGRDFSVNNRAGIRLDSNGDYPADILFGHTAQANEGGWINVDWALSSRNSSENKVFGIWRAGGNGGEEPGIIISPNLNVKIGEENSSFKVDRGYKLWVNGSLFASSFTKSGSSNDYLLLGGGGHKAVSDFATSGHTHDGRYIFSPSIGNNVKTGGFRLYNTQGGETGINLYINDSPCGWFGTFTDNCYMFRNSYYLKLWGNKLTYLGNVGIGTESPSVKVHIVDSSSNTQGCVSINSTADSTSEVSIYMYKQSNLKYATGWYSGGSFLYNGETKTNVRLDGNDVFHANSINISGCLLTTRDYITGRATLVLNSSSASDPCDIIFKHNDSSIGNYGEWTISSRGTNQWGTSCFQIFRGGKNSGTPQEAAIMTIYPSGNTLFSGGITMYSDLRKKNILSDEVLSVKEIAAAPLFRHTYKSDDNQYIHVGTSAQYWSAIHDNWFTRKDSEGYYQMELQNLGVAMGISLAREVIKYETRLQKLERENKKLRKGLEYVKRELENSQRV